MFVFSKRESIILSAASTLVLIILLGCSNMVEPFPAVDLEQAATGPLRQSDQLLRSCDSIEFTLPESEIATAQRINSDEQTRRTSERYDYRGDQLSLHLTLVQDTVGHSDPIASRIAITNDTEQPIIFCRPQAISTMDRQPPLASLFVGLSSVSGEWHPQLAYIQWTSPRPKREDFTVLPPGESCTIDFQVVWKEGTLQSPPPPGDYRVYVHMNSWWGAPEIESAQFEFYDIDAWVGQTKPSNVVTLTISPPEE
jgi:hypothetical protein